MIDIHSHVLPGIDDGSPSFEVSVAMLEKAARHGTKAIVASPHSNLEYRWDTARNQQLLKDLKVRNHAPIEVHLGCDFHLSYENIEDSLKNNRKYTIAGGRYLLVEFSDLLIFKNTSDIFGDLLSARMVPVITHPERNTLLQQRLPALQEWVQMGCAIQVTAQSVMGHFGSRAKKFSETLLDAGMVHFIASDAHDLERRPPLLDDCYPIIKKGWGQDSADRLFIENGAAVLADQPLAGPCSPRKRGLFSFFS